MNPQQTVYRMTELPVGGRGTIKRVEGSEALIKRFRGLGLVSGTLIELRHRTPVPVIRVEHLEVALEGRAAQGIWVSVNGEGG